MSKPVKIQPIRCAKDSEWYRYDVWNEYDDEDHAFDGSGDGDDY